ncbi:MAG: hypothetical protein KGI71_05165 [Patescibacteria group bacterium]|nr:hypothetical protein [Patescibacteria group bacterium]
MAKQITIPGPTLLSGPQLYGALLTGEFAWSVHKINRRSALVDVPVTVTGSYCAGQHNQRLRLSREDFAALQSA